MKKKSVVSWILEFVSLHKFYFIVSLVFAFICFMWIFALFCRKYRQSALTKRRDLEFLCSSVRQDW